MNRAAWQHRMDAQRAERLSTGRPLQAGDIVLVGSEFRVIAAAGSAGECIEARTARDIQEQGGVNG